MKLKKIVSTALSTVMFVTAVAVPLRCPYLMVNEMSTSASTVIQRIENYDSSYISGTYEGLKYELQGYSTGGNTLSIYDDSCYSITGSDKNVTSITIPDKINDIPVGAISSHAFNECTDLKSVNILETITYIGNYAFANCTSLTDVNILGNINFGIGAFRNCSSLEEIKVSGNLRDYAFAGCTSLKKVILTDEVKNISYDSFEDCYNVEYLEIGAGISDVSKLLSQLRYMQEIRVSKDNPSFADIDGVLFNKECTELIKYPPEKNDKNYKINNGVTTIRDNAFKAAKNLVSIDIPDSVSTIEDAAFRDCSNLTSIVIPDSVSNIGGGIFSGCSSLENVNLNKNITKLGSYSSKDDYLYTQTTHGFFEGCKNLKSVVIPDSVTSIEDEAFYNCAALEEIIIPDSVNSIGTNVFACNDSFYSSSLSSVTIPQKLVTPDLIPKVFYGNTNFVLNYNRDKLNYNFKDNEDNKINVASSNTIVLKSGSIPYRTFKNYVYQNNGFDKSYDSLHEISDTDGNIYAVCGYKDYVMVIPKNKNESPKIIENKGFTFGAATFDDQNNLYILCCYNIDVDEYKGNEENIVLVKYNKECKSIGQCAVPVSKTNAQFPLSTSGASSDSDFIPGKAECGNANIRYNNGVIGCFYDTQWDDKTGGYDGIYHQGSEFLAINADTMEPFYYGTWEGSHSFGLTMIPTDYGFAAIQIGDANHDDIYDGRGINFNYWKIEDDSVSSKYFTKFDRNGKFTKFHWSSCIYPIDTEIDETYFGNELHMGGLAKSASTYAIAGKSKRNYSYENYNTLNLFRESDDVFVKLFDQTLCDSNLAGEDRIDLDTGEVADRNVVWLTECNDIEKAGEVKIVTLEDGSYCVLWEKFINDEFDSIHYVILDECGNIIRRETAINNARLSTTSIQPIVQGDTLTWAVGNELNNSLIWYTVNLNEFTTGDELYTPLEELAEENNISLVLEDGCYGTCGDDVCWAYLKESGTLLIAGSGDMNFLVRVPWFEYRNSITDIIIDNKITSVGNNAFSNCKLVTSISLPDSIIELGANAFEGCTKLENICIPESITSINDYAFLGCSNLKNIIIKSSDVAIGNKAFGYCATYSDGEYGYEKIDVVTIYGNPNSTVKTYALENDIEFLEIGSITTTTMTTTTQPTTTTTTTNSTITMATNPIIITTNTKMTTSTTAIESTTLAVTSTTTDTTAEPSTKEISGDVNGDEKVNFKDVVLIRRYIAGGWNIEINEEVADVNGDGKVNFKDVVLIRRYIAGGWNITLK